MYGMRYDAMHQQVRHVCVCMVVVDDLGKPCSCSFVLCYSMTDDWYCTTTTTTTTTTVSVPQGTGTPATHLDSVTLQSGDHYPCC